jgi:hypothetical protein
MTTQLILWMINDAPKAKAILASLNNVVKKGNSLELHVIAFCNGAHKIRYIGRGTGEIVLGTYIDHATTVI